LRISFIKLKKTLEIKFISAHSLDPTQTPSSLFGETNKPTDPKNGTKGIHHIVGPI